MHGTPQRGRRERRSSISSCPDAEPAHCSCAACHLRRRHQEDATCAAPRVTRKKKRNAHLAGAVHVPFSASPQNIRLPSSPSSAQEQVHVFSQSSIILRHTDNRDPERNGQRTRHTAHNRPHPSCACSSACIFHSPLEGLDSQHRHTAGSRACLGDAKEADGGRGVGGGEREGGKER